MRQAGGITVAEAGLQEGGGRCVTRIRNLCPSGCKEGNKQGELRSDGYSRTIFTVDLVIALKYERKAAFKDLNH